jgi:hypothetical protein
LDYKFCEEESYTQKFNIVGNSNNCLYSKYMAIYNLNIPAFRKIKKDSDNPHTQMDDIF